MRIRLRHAASLLAFLAGRAAASQIFGPEAFDRIPAGRVEVVMLEPAAAGVEEREIVLSLDGGRTFPLRLTGEIGPADLQAAWRVPALPTRQAVLALREGGAGRVEEIVAVSAEFTVISGRDLPVEELRFQDGEWRTREASAGDDGLPAPSLRGPAPERCEGLIPDPDGFEEPARGLPAAPAKRDVPVDATAATEVRGDSPPVPFSPLFVPLRE